MLAEALTDRDVTEMAERRHMRQVNLRIEPELYTTLRLYAVAHGTSFQALCDEGLRHVIEQRGIPVPSDVLARLSRGESGAAPGVQADATTKGVARRTRRAWKPSRDTLRTPSARA